MELKTGFKNTEVGLIPSDWAVKPLGDSLISNPDYGINAAASDYSDALPTYLRITDISENGKFIPEKKVSVNHKFSDNYYLEVGDVVFARTGASVGKTYLYNPNDGRLVFAGFLIRVKPNPEKLNSVYLKSLTETMFYWDWVKIMSMRSGQPGINGNEYKLLPIPLPPTLAEQTAIATALADTDEYITHLEKLIAKKRNIKQGAIQELLKPKEGWVVKKLGELGETIIGLTYKPENVVRDGKLVLRSSNIQEEILVFDDNVYVDCAIPSKLILQENDILICVRNGSRDLIGKCAIIKGIAVGETFGAFMSIFRSKLNSYLVHLFKSNIIKRQIDEHLGATINQITNKSLNSFEIHLPPNEKEQTRIATILSDMDSEIATLETKLSKAQSIKQGMMQQLITGKIRLIKL